MDDLIQAALAESLNPSRFIASGEKLRIEAAGDDRHIWLGDDPRPIVSIVADGSTLRVTRNLRIYRAADGGWINEHVATVRMDLPQLSKRLQASIRRAIVGTSRLPITSVESPLPAFSLGRIAYVSDDGSIDTLADRLEAILRAHAGSNLVFALLPVQPPAPPGDTCMSGDASLSNVRQGGRIGGETCPPAKPGAEQDDGVTALKVMFNRLALSPYTHLVDNLVAFLPTLGASRAVDVISYMLRHLVRHLTAFDLVKFHNMGANYPDALMLDALLRLYVKLAGSREGEPPGEPRLGRSLALPERLRRRALRQAWMMRKMCEGLSVPDEPTSPGENLRFLPAPHAPVPEDQLTDASRRTKRLFAGERFDITLPADVWNDLEHPDELRELGMAVFLDRPLGIFKRPGEADRTPLLSYEAFSRRIAERRLGLLRDWGAISSDRHEDLVKRLRDAVVVQGMSVAKLFGHSREGVVALEDARKAAMDFVFMRTTTSSLREFLSHYDWKPLRHSEPEKFDWLTRSPHVLLIRGPRRSPLLTGFDEDMRPRIEIEAVDEGYVEESGVEYLVGGLRINGCDVPPNFTPP